MSFEVAGSLLVSSVQPGFSREAVKRTQAGKNGGAPTTFLLVSRRPPPSRTTSAA